jgi:hypothetical protein
VTKPTPEKCSNFRSGRYIFNMYNETGLGHWRKLSYFITRNDSLEFVTSNAFPNDTSIYRITWTGPCEYRSFLLNPKIGLDSFLVQKYPSGTINTILKVTDDYFIVKNYGNQRDTVWKTN